MRLSCSGVQKWPHSPVASQLWWRIRARSMTEVEQPISVVCAPVLVFYSHCGCALAVTPEQGRFDPMPLDCRLRPTVDVSEPPRLRADIKQFAAGKRISGRAQPLHLSPLRRVQTLDDETRSTANVRSGRRHL